MVGEIKECRHDLLDDVQWLKEQLTSPEVTFDKKVEAAMILWDLSEVARLALEPFKEELRSRAVESGETKWQYHAPNNIQATVVRPSDRVKLKKGANLAPLRATPEWADLIEEVTTYRIRPSADMGNLSDGWHDVLRVENPTPRVSLARYDGLPARRKK